MKSDEHTDPIVRMLSQLNTPVSNAARDRQVRDKCHAAIARRHATRFLEVQRRPSHTRILDVAVAVAASLYGAAALAEAIRWVVLH